MLTFSKKLFLSLLFFLGMISVAYYFFRPAATEDIAGASKQVKMIRVSLSVYGAVRPVNSTYRGLVPVGMTALQLLQQHARVQIDGEGQNAFVTAINNRVVDRSQREFWAFFVNGKPAPVGAGSYILQPNDSIEWKIEKY